MALLFILESFQHFFQNKTEQNTTLLEEPMAFD